jgi:uncharacterized protein YbjT (DUF2867 family)
MANNNLVLVIGGTGAQGAAVIEHLVKDKKYFVRVLTRNTTSRRAQELVQLGNVELFQGDMTNETDLVNAFKGVDLAFVNIDGFAIGEKMEVFWGMRIFEIAMQAGTVRHYVWGNLDYGLQKGGYNPKYRCGHYDGKGRVAQWLRSQPPSKTIWSSLTSGPYMDMLFEFLRPRPQPDGSYVFAAPIGDGAIPLIALEDLGYYCRWLFDHPDKSAGLDLEIATQDVSWHELAATFTEVTGKPAKFVDLPIDVYMSNFDPEVKVGVDGMKWVDNFKGWWALWHDRILTRDYKTLYEIHPQHLTLKSWMKKNNYDGNPKQVLKDIEDGWKVTK